jgi:hypothetical protein
MEDDDEFLDPEALEQVKEYTLSQVSPRIGILT